MQIEPIALGLAQLHIAAAIRDLEQLLQATGAIALEVHAHRIGVDQQDLGNALGPPAGGEQDDGLDAIGLALVARAPVGRPQLRQFVRCEPVVDHGGNDMKVQDLALDS
jgi:hypothetical protein